MFLSPTATGSGALHVAKVRGRSAVLSCWSRSPFTVLTPRTRGASVWAYTSSYGGGMVAGDQTRLEVQLDQGASCFLSTQASTKIYRNPTRRPCSHDLRASLAADSLLVLAPDPVQCFAESSYDQTQHFDLADSANLVLVDWISSGRSARGERWAFRRYATRNAVYRGGRLVLMDPLLLDHESGPLKNRFRTGRFNCLATLVVLGQKVAQFAANLLEKIRELPVRRAGELVLSASPLREGVIVRFAGTRVEEVGRAIYEHLRFLPPLLQGDPWARKW